MLSTYCQECGSKNEYRFSKPKFCSNCGHPLSGEESERNKNKKSPPRETRAERIESDFDEEGTEVYEVPDISRLEYDIETSTSGSFSLGSLFKNVDSEYVEKKPKPKRGRPKKNG